MYNRLELSKFKIGEKIQRWNLELIFGETQPKANNFLNKPLLVLFFNITCPDCSGRAIPYPNRLDYKNCNKIKIVGIHTNFEEANLINEQTQKGKENCHIQFPLYKDFNYDTTFLNYGEGGT